MSNADESTHNRLMKMLYCVGAIFAGLASIGALTEEMSTSNRDTTEQYNDENNPSCGNCPVKGCREQFIAADYNRLEQLVKRHYKDDHGFDVKHE